MTPLLLFAPPSNLGFFGMGNTEMVILLVIILILFGGERLPRLMRGMQDGIHNFKNGMRQDEVWQFSDGRQRQLNKPPKSERSWTVWLVFGCTTFLLIVAGSEEVISAKQMLVALGVTLVCALAWWLCLGKERD